MDSLTFLAKSAKAKVRPLYVIHGDEDFLKRQVMQALRKLILGDQSGDEFSETTYPGDKADYATIMDELSTPAFFGPRRMVVVDQADPFVSRNRQRLEKAVEQLPDTGTLVLDVKTWSAATKLAKKVPAESTLVCKAQASSKLPRWCVEWATRHEKQLTSPAAYMLVELVGTDMGQLDQEIAKLAVYVGTRKRIGEEDVDKLVGRSQAENIFTIFDAIGAGRVKAALGILGQLFDKNEEPMRILGALSMQIRRLAQVHRMSTKGIPLAAAVQEAGISPFFARGCVQQLKHLGPQRAGKLYDWLLELQMDMRGESPLPPQIQLEQWIIRLARKEG